MKQKKQKFEQDKLFKFFSNTSNELIFIFIVALLIIAGCFIFSMFWLGCISDSCINFTNIEFYIIYGLSFFLVLEVVYIWLCKNTEKIDNMIILGHKTTAASTAHIIVNVFIPIIISLGKIPINFYIILLKYIGYILGIIGGILLVAYLFFLLNKLIANIIIKRRDGK